MLCSLNFICSTSNGWIRKPVPSAGANHGNGNGPSAAEAQWGRRREKSASAADDAEAAEAAEAAEEEPAA